MSNIEAIARKAGVSAATVSRTLRNPEKVRTENQRRVVRIAKDLGYTPGRKRRSPGARKTKQIAFLAFSNVLSPESLHAPGTFLPIVNGINSIIQEHGYNLLVGEVGLDYTPPPCLLRNDIDGIIFHGLMPREFWERYIRDLPHVGIQHYDPALPCSWVRIDNERLSFLAVEHLVKLGHRRIGFLADTMEILHSRERYDGYRKALEYFDLPFEKAWTACWQRPRVDGILPLEMELPSYVDRLRPMFDAPETPSAIVTVGTFRARAAIASLREMGLEVPRDVSVSGVCNEESLTAHGISAGVDRFEEICSMAADLLLEYILKQHDRKVTVLVRPSFREGASTGPAAEGTVAAREDCLVSVEGIL
jgi:LacI family transcriptional regulator, repressor for deo operon, udp, cdd, tsx, nupC, and nupG